MFRTPWKPGPAAGTDRPVLVSLTEYRPHRRSDQPRIYRQGLDLRRAWPQLEGAVGMYLWAQPLVGRGGSVSVWESEEALLRFVRWPRHLEVVRHWRPHGTLQASDWWVERFDRHAAWREARGRLVR